MLTCPSKAACKVRSVFEWREMKNLVRFALIVAMVVAVFVAAFASPESAMAAGYTKTCTASVYYGGVKRASFKTTISWETRTYLGVAQARKISASDSITYQQSGWTLSSKQVTDTTSTSWKNVVGSAGYWGERLTSYKVTRTSDGFSPGRYYLNSVPYYVGTISCTSNW
jgi:hypothetical protein